MQVRERRAGGPFLFDQALSRMRGNLIVEIGAIRDGRKVAEAADGWSTKKWADTGMEVICVDTSEAALKTTKRVIGPRDNVSYYCVDGLELLRYFVRPIDLLYIDGPNPDEDGQEFARLCVWLAPMAPNSIILIDDCDFSDDGKGKTAIPLAQEMGFRLVTKGRQALLIRFDDPEFNPSDCAGIQ